MASVEARYLDGSSVQVENCESIGGIMVHIANLHQRFASEITVVCPESGKDLSDEPSQSPPSLVQVVVKLRPDGTQSWADEELLLTLCLHAQHEDAPTCKRAYDILNKKNLGDKCMLKNILDKADGDLDTEAKILRTLFRLGVELKKQNFLLKLACESGDEKKVKMLLSEGVPVDYESGSDERNVGIIDSNKGSALSVAAFEGHADVVKILLAHRADVNNKLGGVKGRYIGTPLIFASEKGHVDVVKILLSSGAVVNLPVVCSWPLGAACEHGQAKVAEVLLAHQADVNYYSTPLSIYLTALSLACKSKSLELTTMLITHGASVNLMGGTNCVALVYANTPDLQKALLAHGAFVNFVCDDGETPLSLASAYNMVDKVHVLLDHGAHINRADHVGRTALIKATRRGRLKVVRTLLERKANVNSRTTDGKTALEYAFDRDQTALVEVLQHHGAIASGLGSQIKLLLATTRFFHEVQLLSRVGSEFSKFSNKVLTDKRKSGIEDCSSASAEKRQKSSGGEACLLGSVVAEEKGELKGDSSFIKEEKDKAIASDKRDSCASTTKDGKTLDVE
eukprot:GEMP01034286.1.p1 GENE.GEMP01034286.1~~GEMP01034286.1.p1  ORF type:complete len:568 (+),score=66.60 GEMP01034286.1:38-1741(+)